MLARLILGVLLVAVGCCFDGGPSLGGVRVVAAAVPVDKDGLTNLRGRLPRLVNGLAAAVGGTGATGVDPSGVACEGLNCAPRRSRAFKGGDVERMGGEGQVQGRDTEADGQGDEAMLQEDGAEGTDVEEGRGKGGGGFGGGGKKKKGYGKMLMILGGMTKAVMLYIMIHAVALLAGKALVIAKLALAIATALALKKSDHKTTSYEIVKHPHYSHSSSVDYDHGGGGGSYEGGNRRRRRARR